MKFEPTHLTPKHVDSLRRCVQRAVFAGGMDPGSDTHENAREALRLIRKGRYLRQLPPIRSRTK